MAWDENSILEFMGRPDETMVRVLIRDLPKTLIDELRLIDEEMRIDREFNLPLWVRVSIRHFIEDYKGIRREYYDEEEDDNEGVDERAV